MSLKGNQISSKGTGNAGITHEKLYQSSTDLNFFPLIYAVRQRELH